MIPYADVIEAARSFRGTPFHHQGRKPHVALDCVGLIRQAAETSGVTGLPPVANYPRDPYGYLERVAEESLVREDRWRDAHVLLFRVGPSSRLCRHAALRVPGNKRMIHVPVDGVVDEVPLSLRWVRRIERAYRIPGVE